MDPEGGPGLVIYVFRELLVPSDHGCCRGGVNPPSLEVLLLDVRSLLSCVVCGVCLFCPCGLCGVYNMSLGSGMVIVASYCDCVIDMMRWSCRQYCHGLNLATNL
jgi:hypothetical protein